MDDRFFVTGNGTDIGKTVISAIVTRAFDADYWKPVQAGDLEHTDSMKVARYLEGTDSVIHPEAFRLTQPMSPHAAAARDGCHISLQSIVAPKTDKALVIEGAGGVYVPLNDEDTILELITYLDAKVILVSRQYLGSINHTLLTWEALERRGITVAGIIFNGVQNVDSEEIILKKTGLSCLLRVPELKQINAQVLSEHALELRENWGRKEDNVRRS